MGIRQAICRAVWWVAKADPSLMLEGGQARKGKVTRLALCQTLWGSASGSSCSSLFLPLLVRQHPTCPVDALDEETLGGKER